jgi:siroheme synthase (precorrin-2 oxidase/ferrochelatase)
MLKRGKLGISISTGGVSPMLVRKIRRELEAHNGEEYELFLDLVQEMHAMIQRRVRDVDTRLYLL